MSKCTALVRRSAVMEKTQKTNHGGSVYENSNSSVDKTDRQTMIPWREYFCLFSNYFVLVMRFLPYRMLSFSTKQLKFYD